MCYIRFGAHPNHMHITINVRKQLAEKKRKRKEKHHSTYRD
jgi:hypothetical protein